MVSIRRRRLLGLDSGSLSQRRKYLNFGCGSSNFTQNTKPVSDAAQSEEENNYKDSPKSSNASGSSMPKEQHIQQYPTVAEVIRHNPYRRKHANNREPCWLRGVYFKNMKWQAAIKVERKQIHLGTVATPKEAARLYDRAAFMRGRETNFPLSEEEKQELNSYEWDEFLAITRSSINKRPRSRRYEVKLQVTRQQPLEQNNDCKDEQRVVTSLDSEDVKLETHQSLEDFTQED